MHLLKLLIWTILFCAGVEISFAQTTYYSRSSGAWNDPSNWSVLSHIGPSAASTPGNSSTDIVIIASGHTINFNANQPVNSITIASLTVGGTLTEGTLRFPFSDYDVAGEYHDLNHNFELSVLGSLTVTAKGDIHLEEGGSGTPALSGAATGRIHQLNIGGALSILGNFELSSTDTTQRCDVKFTGAALQVLSGLASVHHLTIDGVGLSLTSDLNISGDLTLSSGLITANTFTVNFNGTEPQNMTGNFAFFNLRKSGGGPLTLTGTASVLGNLILSDGLIYTSNSDIITILGAGAISGGSDSSYVVGPLVHRVSAGSLMTKVFPFGSGDVYRPITLRVNLFGIVEDLLYKGVLNEGPPPSRTLPIGINKVTDVRYYTISQLTLLEIPFLDSVVASVSIQYQEDDYVATPGDLRILKSDGAGNWLDVGSASNSSSPSGSFFNGLISSNNFNTFSDFALSSSSENNPLPVNFINCEVQAVYQGVDVRWQTASEQNNKSFTIERSADAKQFEDIYTLAGAGDSDTINAYHYLDSSPLKGQSFYRIRQTDYDGTFSYSKILSAHYFSSQALNVLFYPNPIDVQKSSLSIEGGDKDEVFLISIATLKGKVVHTHSVQADHSGSVKIQYKELSFLSKGIYMITISGKRKQLVRKIIVE